MHYGYRYHSDHNATVSAPSGHGRHTVAAVNLDPVGCIGEILAPLPYFLDISKTASYINVKISAGKAG